MCSGFTQTGAQIASARNRNMRAIMKLPSVHPMPSANKTVAASNEGVMGPPVEPGLADRQIGNSIRP